MSYLADYGEAMDYIRDKLRLPNTVSLYEAVVKMVSEYKRMEDSLQKSQKEKKNVGRKKGSRNTGSVAA